MKSNEYDIRAAVVGFLMNQGFDVKDIRIEIPLNTSSVDGRADILILSDIIHCIELKSGKDVYNHETIGIQLEKYYRPFDSVMLVVDSSHEKKDFLDKKGHMRNSNFHPVDLIYHHEEKEIVSKYPWRKQLDLHHFLHNNSRKTSVVDMCNLLWLDEIRKHFAWKKSKEKFVNYQRENGKLCEVRPIVIEALRTRKPNAWEVKFWNKYLNK